MQRCLMFARALLLCAKHVSSRKVENSIFNAQTSILISHNNAYRCRNGEQPLTTSVIVTIFLLRAQHSSASSFSWLDHKFPVSHDLGSTRRLDISFYGRKSCVQVWVVDAVSEVQASPAHKQTTRINMERGTVNEMKDLRVYVIDLQRRR